MATGWFAPSLFDFLFDLDVHNEKSWFDANRDRFEQQVREPVLAFVRAAEQPLHSHVSRHLVADDRKSGGSMFRIHRDTRFSSDKRPYKTNVGVQFRHEAGKDAHAPGLYLHLEPGNCFAAAGTWHPDMATLTRVRDEVVAKPGPFKRMLGQLDGSGWELSSHDALTRAPRGYPPDHPLVEQLKRRSWILGRTMTEDQVCAPDFLDTYIGWGRQARPLLRWLCRILEQPF
jgi:uncharacterized protein (TIGR02453 family)